MARSLKKNFLYQSTWQLLIILVPLITTPYLSRTLGAYQVGVFSYTYAIADYFVMFATLGMSTYGVRTIAACGDDRNERSKTFWNAYTGQFFVAAIVLLVYIGYSLTSPQGGFIIAAVWGMWVVSALLDASWLLFGVEEFKIPTIRSIVTKLAGVVVIFAFVKGPDDLWIYCAAIAGSFLINQLLIWPFVRRYVHFVKPSFSEVKRHLGPSARLFIPVIAISLYVMLDKVMLGMMSGMTQTGYFEYSEKLSKLPRALITAVGTVMLPRMTLELKRGNRDEAMGLLDNSVWAMLAMAFAVTFGIIGIAPEFAVVFLGEEFASCDVLMCILALATPLIATTNVLGRQYLLPTERDTLFTISVCVGAVVNICLNLILIPMFAATGASISTVAAEFSVLVAQVIFVRKELPLARYLKNALPFAGCGLLMCITVRASGMFFDSLWGMSVQGLLLEIVVGVVAFIVLALAWCLVSKDPHLGKVLGQVKKK